MDATPSFGIDDLQRATAELAARFGLKADDVGRAEGRLERFEAETQGAFPLPTVEEALDAGADPGESLRWLLTANLERESAPFVAWQAATDPNAPTLKFEMIPEAIERAGAHLKKHRKSLALRGVAPEGTSWIERRCSDLYADYLCPFVERGDGGARLTADLELLHPLRVVVGACRTAVLRGASTAIDEGDPSQLWDRSLAGTPPELDLSCLALASRMDAAFAAVAESGFCGGVRDLLYVSALLEGDLVWRYGCEVAERVADVPAARGYLAVRLGREWSRAEDALHAIAVEQSRQAAYVARRVPEMATSLRRLSRARTSRTFHLVAEGRTVPESRGTSRWDVPGKTAARRTELPPEATEISISGENFSILGVELKHSQGTDKKRRGVRPTNNAGRWLVAAITGTLARRAERDRGARRHLNRALRAACIELKIPIVSVGLDHTSNFKLAFDSRARKAVARS
jgi:hypothetical protein